MANDNIYISVVIPAYNEERRIGKTIESIVAYFKDKNYAWELIVVNDGSVDKTVSVVKQFCHRAPLVLIDNHMNRGKGAAIHQGMRMARGMIAVFMDADNATKIQELDKAIPLMNKGVDMVIGSRRLSASKIVKKQPMAREMGGRIFSLFVRALFAIPYLDTQAGFKVFDKKARELIFSKQQTYGWSFDVELIMIAKRCGLRIAEIPIAWQDQNDSKVKPFGILKSLFDLVRLKYMLLR